MKKRLISVLLVIALLATVGVIAVQAAAGDTERTVFLNSVHTTADAMSFTADVEADCPYCQTKAEWKALPAATGEALDAGHYYVPVGGLKNTTNYLMNSSSDYCIHLNNQTLSSAAEVILTGTASGNEVRIMGQGTVKSEADVNAIRFTCGNFYIMGGSYELPENASKNVFYAPEKVGNTAIQGTKRLFVCEGADVKGTIYAVHASAYMIGGHIERAVLGSGNTYTGNYYTQTYGVPEIGGKVVIDELDITGDVLSPRELYAAYMEAGASITVKGTGNITRAIYATSEVDETDASANAVLQYFHAAEPDTHEIKVEAASKGYRLVAAAKANVPTCDGCGQTVESWTEVTTLAAGAVPGGHYKLMADLNLDGALTFAEGACINLNGKNVTSTGRVLEVTAGTVTVFGEGNVIGAATEGNAATVLVSGGELNLKGGTFKHDIASTLPTVYTEAAVTMEDGAKITAEDGVIGNNVYVKSGTFVMDGGEISNATAEKSGNVYVAGGTFTLAGGEIKDGAVTSDAENPSTTGGANINKQGGTLKITGGKVSGGKAPCGGNILIKSGNFTMSGGTVENGEATYGGNIYLNNISSATGNVFTNCTVQNGTAEHGGNLAFNSTYATVSTYAVKIQSGAKFLGGKATAGYGGNILVRSGTLTISDTAVVSGGEAKTGGTIAIAEKTLITGNSKAPIVNLLGGTVTGGEVQAHGALLFCDVASANVYVNAGTYNEGKANLGGESGKRACNGLYMRAGTMTLSGGIFNCSGAYNAIYLGGSGSNIPALVLGKHSYTSWATAEKVVVNDTENTNKAIGLNALATLNVTEDFDDTLYLGFVSSPAYGAPVPNAESAGDAAAFTGKLYMGSRTGNPPILPATYTVTSVNEETQEETTTTVNGLVVAGAQYVKADGEAVWTKDMAAAAAATDAAYVKAYKDETITIPADTTKVVDLNGNTVTVEGEGAFQGFDSANADYKTHGYAKLAAGIENKDTALVITGADGEKYIVLSDENGVSYHRFESRIKSVALKPETVGLYYRVVWQADDTLKAASADMGIALSTSKALSDFANITTATILDKTQKDFRFAQYLPTTIVNNEEQASVLVDGIMKAGLADNSARGQVTIQAVPYLVVGDQVLMGDGRSVSLQGFMLMADQDANYEKNATALEAFYEKWAEYMPAAEGWAFNNIGVKKEA